MATEFDYTDFAGNKQHYYRNDTPVPTIDLTVKEDGTLRQYRVREFKGYGSVTVSATSKEQAKEMAREQGLSGKLVVDIL